MATDLNHAQLISALPVLTLLRLRFLPSLLGCSNSSQYRKRAGRDFGIGHPLSSPHNSQ